MSSLAESVLNPVPDSITSSVGCASCRDLLPCSGQAVCWATLFFSFLPRRHQDFVTLRIFVSSWLLQQRPIEQTPGNKKALIHGSIAADQVTVFGRINGAILGSNVILHSSAQVEGDIHSRSLSIEQGASFNGRSRTVSDPAEVAPQLEAEGETERAPASDTEDTSDDEIQIPTDSEEFTPTRDFG